MVYDTKEEKEVSGKVDVLFDFIQMQNIADDIEKDELNAIGYKAVEEYEEDEGSLDEWREQNKQGLDLARQVYEKKTWPWENASNIKYPLIGQAAMNFNARAYPEIVQGDKVVKAKIVGVDQDQQKADRAERISDHMSYQLTEEIPNWEMDTDKLLIQLPIVGTMFREVTWSEIENRPEINLLMPDDITVNYNAKSIELSECRRISKKITMFKNDIVERERAGLWLEIGYTQLDDDGDEIEKDEQEFIQQLRYLDLDNDGYEEPYMVVVHYHSKQVVRIYANYDENTIKFDERTSEVTRIDPFKIYTDYHFIPSFDGSFYSLGFGQYLYPINQAIDTLTNQLIDSGTLNNLQSGFFAKGMRMRSGTKPLEPGEWRPVETKGVDMRNAIVPLPTKEPSPTLYNLLMFLIDTGKDMSSITDVLSGVPQGQNTPVGTTMAMIEQGMKVVDAIYKRVYRALRSEFKMLYRLNSMFLDPAQYAAILDDPNAKPEDYNVENMDIIPVGDPKISSQMARIMKAQAVRDVAGSTPGANLQEASRQLLVAMDIDDSNIEAVIPQQDPNMMMQQVEYLQGMVEQFQQYIQSGQLQMQMDQNNRDNQESAAKVRKDNASAIETLAKAEAVEPGTQLEIYKAELSRMSETFKQQKEVVELEQQANQQRVSGMGQSPGNV
jgi:chaperonin GroES